MANHVDVDATSSWTDALASNPDFASVQVLVQNKGPGVAQVFRGGDTAPAEDDAGWLLRAVTDAIVANDANLWVRSPTSAKVQLMVQP